MADQTDETKRAQAEADAFQTEQARRLALSHADDRPAVSVAALAPRNRPVDVEGGETERAPEVRGDVESFEDDPARGLEPEVSDVPRRTSTPETQET